MSDNEKNSKDISFNIIPPVLPRKKSLFNSNYGKYSLSINLFTIICFLALAIIANPPNFEKAVESCINFITKVFIFSGFISWQVWTYKKKKLGLGVFFFSLISSIWISSFSIYSIISIEQTRYRNKIDHAWANNAKSGFNSMVNDVRQLKVGDGNYINMTGDSDNDQISQYMNTLMNETTTIIVSMANEIKSLNLKPVFDDDITNTIDILESEADKRVLSQQIIKRYSLKFDQIPKNISTKVDKLSLSSKIKAACNLSINKMWSEQKPQINLMFALLVKQQQAEMDYLRFMTAWYSKYEMKNHTIYMDKTFDKVQYHSLIQQVKDTSRANKEFSSNRMKKFTNSVDALSKIGEELKH
jgi:hypothetical protein